MVSTIQRRPYLDMVIGTREFIREFAESNASNELVWHRDHNTRKITVIEGTGWKLQLDNQFPQLLEVNKEVIIPAGEFHRLIKGNSILRIHIQESL